MIEDGAFIGSDTQLIAPVTRRQGRLRRRPARRSPRTCRPARSALRAAGRRTSKAGSSAKEEHRSERTEKAARQGLTLCAESSATSDRSRSCPCSSTACGAWNIAATTRPASRSSARRASTLRRSAGKLANLETGDPRRPGRRRLRRRPHALGDARPADRGERPSAPRLHRPDRRRPQRHHRELPRAEAASCRRRATSSRPKPTPKSSRTWSSARCTTTASRTRCAAR